MPTRKSITSWLVKTGWLRAKAHPRYETYSLNLTIQQLLRRV